MHQHGGEDHGGQKEIIGDAVDAGVHALYRLAHQLGHGQDGADGAGGRRDGGDDSQGQDLAQELSRFFGDKRLVVSILLPGILVYVMYS